MSQQFRFSPRSNRAADIHWRSWGAEAFAEAVSTDRPVLLCLTAVWCNWCHQMDETTYSDPAVIEILNQSFVPVRVDADQYPHVHDRYIATGWPTNAFLTPTGEVLWAGTYVIGEQFVGVAQSVKDAWSERRQELAVEIERRRKALEAARGRVKSVGLVRREAADDVWNSVLESFDARNGGFGTEPKYPTPDAIELAFVRGTQDNVPHIAPQTLDGMLAGELFDEKRGGAFRYALAEDWTSPQTEKLLTTNGGLLRIYAMGASLTGNQKWRECAERIADYAQSTLRLEHGLWSASQAADPAFYAGASNSAPGVDQIVYTNANAYWLRCLADAGARLNRPEWVGTAVQGIRQLLNEMAAPNGLFFHYRETDGALHHEHLLMDAAEVAAACLVIGQAAGDAQLIAEARRIVEVIEKLFWADDGGFYDRTRSNHDVGVLRYRDRPFDLNASLSRTLLDLAAATGERSFRALAERTLAILSPLAGRFAVGGACFALAVHEFFDPPVQLVVTGSGADADALRQAALALPLASRHVWPLPEGGRFGANNCPRLEHAALYAVGAHGMTKPVTDPALVAEAVAHIV
jgi:uncharacterized protein